jgi:hypothetical protein
VNINLKKLTSEDVAFFSTTADYLIYIGAPALIIVIVAVSICVYMKVKASEDKVSELEKIEDIHFNSDRYIINGRP